MQEGGVSANHTVQCKEDLVNAVGLLEVQIFVLGGKRFQTLAQGSGARFFLQCVLLTPSDTTLLLAPRAAAELPVARCLALHLLLVVLLSICCLFLLPPFSAALSSKATYTYKMHASGTLHASSRTIRSTSKHHQQQRPLLSSPSWQHDAAAKPELLSRQLVVSRVFGNKNSTNRQQQQQQPGSPTQQQQIDLEQLRRQGGYNYPPQQPQQQPWQWDQQTQQQQQQAPYQQQGGGPATQTGGGGSGGNGSGGGSNGSDGGGLSGYTKALIAAAFVTGLGAGVYFDAEINLSPNQVASTEIIDRRTPNAEVCMAYGYSAMVFDQRVFVTYNPFNLYVTQPEVSEQQTEGMARTAGTKPTAGATLGDTTVGNDGRQ